MRNWRNEAIKVACLAAGIGVYFLTATPQTPEALSAYLSGRGYEDVQVEGPATRCGRAKQQFAFRARTAERRPVTGVVCMDSHAFNYWVKVDPVR